MFTSLPTNVKQIGSISEGMRIYMEDYVCTYLNQYAQEGGYDERLALLVGRYLLIDSQPVLFINGAIQGRHTEERDGLLCFTEKSKSYAEAMIDEFFEGSELVGWMQTQPGYGVFLNQQYAAQHYKSFPKISQVMFVMDPLEDINVFYTYNEERSTLIESKGYFIYYERNTSMHEYMLSSKATEAAREPKPATFLDTPAFEKIDSASPSPSLSLGLDPLLYSDKIEESPEEIIRKRQEQRGEKRFAREHRRTMNLLVSMSAVLFIVCFILGAGLVQSHDRIGSMESQIFQLSTAYRNLSNQVANPVFAPSAYVHVPETVSANEEELEDADQEQNQEAGLEIDGIPVNPPVNVSELPTAAELAQAQNLGQVRHVPETYTIQPGDSLSVISMYFYGVDRVEEILAINGLENADMIIAGRTILLP